MSLVAIPLSVLGIILCMACDGGGPTSSALRLVNHYMHDAVDPYRFRTVMVTGASSTYALVAQLLSRSAPSEERPILHVFLSDESPNIAPLPPPQPLVPGEDDADEYDDLEDGLDDMRTDTIDREIAMTCLLQIAAPTLRSAAIANFAPFSQGINGILGATAFPRLEYLAANVGDTEMFVSPKLFTPLMPSLRIGDFDLRGIEASHGMAWVKRFALHCPTLGRIILEAFLVHPGPIPSPVLAVLHAGRSDEPVTVKGLLAILQPSVVVEVRPQRISAAANPQLVEVKDEKRVKILPMSAWPPTYKFWEAKWRARMEVREALGGLPSY
jgi:hypothetical protein